MGIYITGTGLYTPPFSISNAELVQSLNAYVEQFNTQHADEIARGTVLAKRGSTPEFIEKASGIKARYVMNKSGVLDINRMKPDLPERSNDEWSLQCEMAVFAAQQAMQFACVTADDLDMVIMACSNFQRAYPAMAIEVQAALGMTHGFAFDMNVACSSATFGIGQAYNALKSGMVRRVLLVNPEITSGHLNWTERDSHFIFGDVCTAMILETLEPKEVAGSRAQFEILDVHLLSQFSNNIRNNFGFLNRADDTTRDAPDKLFKQNGQKVYREVAPLVAHVITGQAKSLNVDIHDIKRFWLHQANANMNALILKLLLGAPTDFEHAPIILDEYANTSSAGSIIAFHKHSQDLKPQDIGVICSFGAGYSIGSVVVQRV